MCWRAGIASPPTRSALAQGGHGGHRLLVHEGLVVCMGMLRGKGLTCAGRAGLAPLGLPAEVHSGLALWHAALSCQAAGKAERTFVLKATGCGASTQPTLTSASPSALQQPQPQRRRHHKAISASGEIKALPGPKGQLQVP